MNRLEYSAYGFGDDVKTEKERAKQKRRKLTKVQIAYRRGYLKGLRDGRAREAQGSSRDE